MNGGIYTKPANDIFAQSNPIRYVMAVKYLMNLMCLPCLDGIRILIVHVFM